MYDKKFYKLLDYVLADEGGYNNDRYDRGGETNLGITQTALNEYTGTRHLPTQSVKNITKDLATKIYYEDYYIKSGADKQKDIRDAYILFDTAIQNGPISAKQMFKNADENFYKLLKMREQHYYNQVEEDPRQKRYIEGWLNRLNRIEERANQIIKEPEFRDNYSSDEKTPFDDDYQGVLNKVENLTDQQKEALKNKYEYTLNKNNSKSNIEYINKYSHQEDKKQSFNDEIKNKYKKIVQSRNNIIANRKNASNSNYGKGNWVTINGHHVFISS